MTDSAPIPTNHVHETGMRHAHHDPPYTARRGNAVIEIMNEAGDVVHRYPKDVSPEYLAENVRQFGCAAAMASAGRSFLLREQEDESALVDELVEAGWEGDELPLFIEDRRREIVRRILAAQKKRAES